MADDSFVTYLECVKKPFVKRCRLRFLYPDGSTAYAIDNNPKGKRNKAFISDGSITVNLQNGQRRSCSITLNNVNFDYDFAYGKLWFGSEVAVDEGMALPNGEEFYIQQGVFLFDSPQDNITPNQKTVTYTLVDKWANLDGSRSGKLESTYAVSAGTNIFEPITELLAEDRGNGQPVDNITPVYTNYYDDKTQDLPDGSTVSLATVPYDLEVNGGSSKADVILGLVGMINGWVGYDQSGTLRVEASQDDISDSSKPVLWRFTQKNSTLLGMTYSTNVNEVYNEYIVVGEQLDDNYQPSAKAQNLDPASDTNINIIGRKTFREEASGYGTDTQCADLAVWKLKRATVLNKSVTISCTQLFHIYENALVEIERTDKPGNPMERHLIQGFSRPLAGTGAMTINAVSVLDFPNLKVTVKDGTETFG